MQQLFKSLPDDKPITAICIVEDPVKCPTNFSIVSKTHDQDSDADLWKDTTFFGRKICRYICYSKVEGIADYIVENIGVIGDKDLPPDGYSLIPRTIDGDQKAWKKRQICYSLTRRNLATVAVTDIILLSKAKRAPEGFSLAGDINGLALCYKISTEIIGQNKNGPSLGYSLNPSNAESKPGNSKSPITNGGVYPILGKSSSPNDEYVNLIRPSRPAPEVPPRRPPPPNIPGSYATITSYQGLEGVPFILNPGYDFGTSDLLASLPKITPKTKEQIDKEYCYDFRLERQT